MSVSCPYVIFKSLSCEQLFAKTQTMFRHCELPNSGFRLSVAIRLNTTHESVL